MFDIEIDGKKCDSIPRQALENHRIQFAAEAQSVVESGEDGEKQMKIRILTDGDIQIGSQYRVRFDFDGFDEKESFRNSIPLLIDHNHDRMSRIGEVIKESVQFEQEGNRKAMVCSVRFSDASPEAQRIKADIEQGLPEQFSVGVFITKVKFNKDYDEATYEKWSLQEVSVVSIGANRDTAIKEHGIFSATTVAKIPPPEKTVTTKPEADHETFNKKNMSSVPGQALDQKANQHDTPTNEAPAVDIFAKRANISQRLDDTLTLFSKNNLITLAESNQFSSEASAVVDEAVKSSDPDSHIIAFQSKIQSHIDASKQKVNGSELKNFASGAGASISAEQEKMNRSLKYDLIDFMQLAADPYGNNTLDPNKDHGELKELNAEFCREHGQTRSSSNAAPGASKGTPNVIIPIQLMTRRALFSKARTSEQLFAAQQEFSVMVSDLPGLTTVDRQSVLYSTFLRNGSVLPDLNVTTINLTNPSNFAVGTAGITSHWGTGQDTTNADQSNLESTIRSLIFRTIRTYTDIGRQALKTTEPSILQLTLDEAMASVAQTLCEAVIRGTVASDNSQPTGIISTDGITAFTLGANSRIGTGASARSKPNYDEVYQHITETQTALLDQGNMVNPMSSWFLASARTIGALMTTPRFESSHGGIAVREAGSMYASIDGFKAINYQGMTDNQILFGVGMEMIVAMFGAGVEVRWTTEDVKSGGGSLGLYQDCDCIVRRPEGFTLSTALLTA